MGPRMLRLLTVILAIASLLDRSPRWADAADKRVAPYPLDPLSKDEIAVTTAVLKDAGKVAEATRFVLIHLHEPPKEKVLAYRPGRTLPRQAFAVLYDWDSNTTSEAVVDFAAKKLLSWKNVPRRQPAFLPEDDHPKTAEILRADPRWREAMKKRGVKDIDKIDIRGWPLGAYANGNADGHRRTFVTMFAREYGPIEDLFVLVDLTAKKIVKLEDRGVNEARRKRGDFAPIDERDQGAGPEGPSSQPPPRDARFQVHGNEVRWGHWRFRFGLHARDGAGAVHGRLRGRRQGAAHPLSRLPVRDGCAVWRSELDFLVSVRRWRVRHGRLREIAAKLRPRCAEGRGLLQRLAARPQGQADGGAAALSPSMSATAACCGGMAATPGGRGNWC